MGFIPIIIEAGGMADLCDALPGGGDESLWIEEAAHPHGEGLQRRRPVVTHASRHAHLRILVLSRGADPDSIGSLNADPDPGGQKLPKKNKISSSCKVLPIRTQIALIQVRSSVVDPIQRGP